MTDDPSDALGWDDVPEGVDPADLERLRRATTWQPYEGDDQPIGPDGKWLNGYDLTAWVRERSPVVMVAFSMGKDSIATMERVREFWEPDQITAFHLSVWPAMDFERRSLSYYRERYGVRILHLPHRSTYRMLRDGLLQPPHHLPVIWGAGLGDFTYPAIYWLIAEHVGILDENPWVARGVRAADSPMRRMLAEKHGPWRRNERVFEPVWDYRSDDVRAALDRTGLKLPVDYRLFGRTFDGLDYRFTEPMRETFPDDYERLREVFPFIELERWRRGGAKPDERD